ncbi:hypothetical protein EPJ64_08270 [Brachyspira aalborgi]|uniref:hypothetical protein n=1 Tax=Brachyspira aalborgi TaxID=29522 RepID=UPI0011CA8E75|nr:hypothetical protein [Brachyspira aalborgi]TXJ15445.1 hypothetical protein EPJ77_09950 [Brachyspira aalborgi]TXJ17918.1 hypothetical protein EPJ64_08270 [Brachyspira aalborgi]TXJ47975.1 hypothetical protein EPJ75_09460 [Brachyspira aalborgi]
MNTIKNVFTMLMLKLIKFLLGFSSRLVPLLIIALAILKSTKIIELNSKYIITIIVVEAILIIFNLIFNSLFFKNKEKEEANNETDNKIKEENKKFPILNTISAFFGFLTLIFILLKIFKAINWQWIWVLSPLWLSTALIISILIIAIIIFIISLIFRKDKDEVSDDNSNNNIN